MRDRVTLKGAIVDCLIALRDIKPIQACLLGVYCGEEVSLSGGRIASFYRYNDTLFPVPGWIDSLLHPIEYGRRHDQNKLGRILCRTKELLDGSRYDTYELRGGPRFMIDPFLAWDYGDGKRFTLGPYRFIVTDDRDRSLPEAVCTNYWAWPVLYIFSKLGQFLSRIKYNIVLTAFIWGFAEHQAGAVPQWRDIHIVRWILTIKEPR